VTAATPPDRPNRQGSLLVEGWRHIPHSYAITNQFLGLEMVNRPGLRFAHRDAPRSDRWKPTPGLFTPQQEETIRNIPAPTPEERFDAVLRLTFPYDCRPSGARRTLVFGTAEWRAVPHLHIVGGRPLPAALKQSDALVVTSSRWSRDGFLASGAAPERVAVVPLGVDPTLYRPLDDGERRAALRRRFKLDGFTFLTIGAMTGNKGVGVLLKAFAALLERHPDATLLAKGLDDFYGARANMLAGARELTDRERARVLPRFLYIGAPLSFQGMAELYQAADAYVSPYLGEGFNMPVLEAAACGLPVICTNGGSTDDFTTPDFSLRIASTTRAIVPYPQLPDFVGTALKPDLDHLIDLMTQAIERPDIGARARRAGPAFVSANFTWRHSVDRLLDIAFGDAPGAAEDARPTG
jgi:glycosyltransferase involved in cell wall biosynthesis